VVSSNINRTTFSSADSNVNKITLLGVRKAIPITVIKYCFIIYLLLSVLITISEYTIVKFLTNENVKHAEILKRLRAQFGHQGHR